MLSLTLFTFAFSIDLLAIANKRTNTINPLLHNKRVREWIVRLFLYSNHIISLLLCVHNALSCRELFSMQSNKKRNAINFEIDKNHEKRLFRRQIFLFLSFTLSASQLVNYNVIERLISLSNGLCLVFAFRIMFDVFDVEARWLLMWRHRVYSNKWLNANYR